MSVIWINIMRTRLQNIRKRKTIINYGDWIIEITNANYVQRYFALTRKKKNY